MSFKEQFREVLVEFGLAKPKEENTPTIELGAIATVDGSLKIEFEGAMLALGAEVWMTDENGEKQSVPDGEYPLENDMIVIIADSKCVEIKEQEMPEQPTEDVEMENDKFKALETKVNELQTSLDNFKLSIATQIADGFTKLSEAVKEENEVEEIKLTKKQEQKEPKEIKEGSLKDRLKSILNN